MKKITGLVLVIALLSGCATDNRHLAELEDLMGTTLGASAAYLIAVKTGANPDTVIGAGILGGIGGHKAVKASQWEDTGSVPSRNIVILPSGAPYGYGAYGGHYDRYGNRLYGAYGPEYYGGWRNDGYCHSSDGWRIPCPGAYSAPLDIVAVPTKPSSGPTVDNYLDSSMIHPDCKTGNYGVDGKCLLRLVPALKEEQKICEDNPKEAKCPKGYNPGKWAQIYRRLGGELISRQRE